MSERRILHELAARKPPTAEENAAKIPFYVKGKPGTDHKCGSCALRIPGNPTYCGLVIGTISFAKGTCSFWVKGPAAKSGMVHERRLEKDAAGYVETDEPVNCASCRFFSDTEGGWDVEPDRCKVWEGKAGPGDCCGVWEPRT